MASTEVQSSQLGNELELLCCSDTLCRPDGMRDDGTRRMGAFMWRAIEAQERYEREQERYERSKGHRY